MGRSPSPRRRDDYPRRDDFARTREWERERNRDRRRQRSRERVRSRSRDRQEIDRRNRRSRSGERPGGRRRRSRSNSSDRNVPVKPQKKQVHERPAITAADLEGKSPEEQEMIRLMGFGGFDSSKGKKVENNDVGEVQVVLKRKYRQYMNRKGGFNRPLDFVA